MNVAEQNSWLQFGGDQASGDALSREVMQSIVGFRKQAIYNARRLPFNWVQI